MDIKTSKRQKNYKALNGAIVSNPLKQDIKTNSITQQSLKLTIDKIAFGFLGAAAIYAFYTALASLML